MKIPMLDLRREYEYMKVDIDIAIQRCLAHQQWILGPEVQEFEEKVANYLEVPHCVGVSSGTDALVLALRALALKTTGNEYFDRKDLIITTPFTFTATGDAILRAGATPAFVDIDPRTYNINPDRIEEFLKTRLNATGKTSSRVVGIIPVHLYGLACDMDRIGKIAQEWGLFVVEDVAQAFGGTWKGRKLGSFGDCGTFSFFPSKNLGAFGDAGMVSTGDEELAELIRMLLKHGGKDKYNVNHIGYNARLDTLQAAVLLAKLKYVDEFNERRKRIAAKYDELLQGMEGLKLPSAASDAQRFGHVFHQYTVRVGADVRSDFQKYLQDKGIATMVYYPVPLHKMRVFQSGRSIVPGELSAAEDAATEVVSLPVEPLMTRDETKAVAGHVTRFFAAAFQ
jgi:dTDP-4-amino-4,6-dideoxygalactose transaminase